MTLATADQDCRPSARMVLLKSYDERGFVFYTNYNSRKARELEANPYAALVIYWAQLDYQVRVEGTVARVSKQESNVYFQLARVKARLEPSPHPKAKSSPAGRNWKLGPANWKRSTETVESSGLSIGVVIV